VTLLLFNDGSYLNNPSQTLVWMWAHCIYHACTSHWSKFALCWHICCRVYWNQMHI